MHVRIKDEVLNELKQELEKRNKSAVRITLEGFGWGGPRFGVVLDEQRNNDEVYEYQGVKFVAEDEFAFLINGFEINKDYRGFRIGGGSSCF